jgi:hypothetical protein
MGDVVTIDALNIMEDWLYCCLNGNWGYVPKSYVEITGKVEEASSGWIDKDSKASQSTTSMPQEDVVPSLARVLHDCEGSAERSELPLIAGMIITVTPGASEGWLCAEIEGHFGYVPSHSVEIIGDLKDTRYHLLLIIKV